MVSKVRWINSTLGLNIFFSSENRQVLILTEKNETSGGITQSHILDHDSTLLLPSSSLVKRDIDSPAASGLRTIFLLSVEKI
jgi:hypothetical protein